MSYQLPGKSEYFEYYQTYIDKVPAGQPLLGHLKETGAVHAAFIRKLPADRLGYRYGEGKWTVRQVLQHVMDAERVFAYRALSIARGEQKNLPEFDHNAWAEIGTGRGRSANSLADEFESIRSATLTLFSNLDDASQTREGTASGHPVSVRALAWIIAGHAIHHINIIAKRYLAVV